MNAIFLIFFVTPTVLGVREWTNWAEYHDMKGLFLFKNIK